MEGLAALADALLACVVVIVVSVADGNQRGKKKAADGVQEKREAERKEKTNKHDRRSVAKTLLCLFFFSLSPVQRARKFSAVLGTTSERSCLLDLCMEKKRLLMSSSRKGRQKHRSRREDRWPFDRHRSKKKKKDRLSLQQQQTTHRHLDAAQRGAIGGNVKENDGVGHFCLVEEEKEK